MMKKFDAVLWNLEETRKVYIDRIKFNENPKVKEYLLKRLEEFTEAISILNVATVNEANRTICDVCRKYIPP